MTTPTAARYPAAAYAIHLPESRRDHFARFAQAVPFDAVANFLRAQRASDAIRAAPQWFYASR